MTSSLKQIPLYHLELVRDRSVPYTSVLKTEQRAQVLHELLDRSPVEQLVVMYLNPTGDLVGVEKVGMGAVTHVSATMAEVFRGAILAAVPSIVIGHNHVDDNLTPSTADWKFTDMALMVGEQLGVFVEDHIIVGPGGEHLSMRSSHNMKAEESVGMMMSLLDGLPENKKKDLYSRIKSLGLNPDDLPRKMGSYFLDPPALK